MLHLILNHYGIDSAEFEITPFGSGLINRTWKVDGKLRSFILQQLNTKVFSQPNDIAHNLRLLADYLKETTPSYLFAAPLATLKGNYLVESEGCFFRLLPFISNSHTVNYLTESAQAYEAALQFGKLTSTLNNFDITHLKYPIAEFHNLNLRIAQLEDALEGANEQRISQAQNEIVKISSYSYIVDKYVLMKQDRNVKLRVIHHDTKINNVLFNDAGKGMAIVDLDTIMPGYFISDVGDMMRTYLAEASEEEQDIKAITVRNDFFAAIYAGYLEAMGMNLTESEKSLFIYSGEFMIYMQAVRFLTDFLNNDIYYPINYAGHNLMRAQNQLKLLDEYTLAKPDFEQIISNPRKEYLSS